LVILKSLFQVEEATPKMNERVSRDRPSKDLIPNMYLDHYDAKTVSQHRPRPYCQML
jgi:hypothetical protein